MTLTAERQIAQQRLEAVCAQHPEITLQHAIEYLEPFGVGKDMEYNRARCILQYALAEVKAGR